VLPPRWPRPPCLRSLQSWPGLHARRIRAGHSVAAQASDPRAQLGTSSCFKGEMTGKLHPRMAALSTGEMDGFDCSTVDHDGIAFLTQTLLKEAPGSPTRSTAQLSACALQLMPLQRSVTSFGASVSRRAAAVPQRRRVATEAGKYFRPAIDAAGRRRRALLLLQQCWDAAASSRFRVCARRFSASSFMPSTVRPQQPYGVAQEGRAHTRSDRAQPLSTLRPCDTPSMTH
jgi:hypothetical protein